MQCYIYTKHAVLHLYGSMWVHSSKTFAGVVTTTWSSVSTQQLAISSKWSIHPLFAGCTLLFSSKRGKYSRERLKSWLSCDFPLGRDRGVGKSDSVVHSNGLTSVLSCDRKKVKGTTETMKADRRSPAAVYTAEWAGRN